MQAETGCIGQYPFSNCGHKAGYLIPFLLIAYIIATNVLLLNLLIAMMNDTYTAVKDEARRVWNKQRTEMLLEYASSVRR